MKWFRKKPDDLITRCQAENEALRLAEPEHNPRKVTAAGGWCAPSTVSYDILNANGTAALRAAPHKDWIQMEPVWG